MNKNLVFILFIVMTIIISCATVSRFENSVNSWLGGHIGELLSAWGEPEKKIKLPNGNLEYIYNITKRYNLVLPDACVVYFEVSKEQKIIRIHHKGNRCKRAPSFV